MEDTSNKRDTKAAKRHYTTVVAFAVVLVAVCLILFSRNETVVKRIAPLFSGTTEEPATSSFARSAPTHLKIAKLNLEADFVPPLGLNEDKTISVPDSYTKVGWYKNGATPGEIGPAVILGHVDSYEGPAVFFSLGQLEEGDEIEVTRADGTSATFIVDELRRYEQGSFPTEQVYGKINHAGLRLVTCSGLYDKGNQRYTHNLVVYASLKVDETVE